MTATEEAPTTGAIGDRMLRKEDGRLVTGEARFVDDLVVPGALWMGMVRSPFAHARITGIDTSAAAAMPGVRHVFTGADLRDGGAWANPMPCAWPVTDDMKAPDHWPVALDKACHVGDIVAVVVADSRYEAADAVDAVVVDYDPLDAVVDIEDAASDRVVIHEGLGTNRSYTWTLSPDPEAVERAFADAAHVVQRALPAPAAHPGGHGAPRRRRRAGALRRRPHALLGHADPPHPQGDDRPHLWRAGTEGAGDRPGRRRRVRLQAGRLRRGVPRRGAGAAPGRPRPVDRDPQRGGGGDDPRPRPRPGHRAGRRRRRAGSPRCGRSCSATWARTCSSSPPASRSWGRSSTTASTTCPPTTSSARGCSRPGRRPTPTGAPVGPRRPTRSSGPSRPWPGRWASTRRRSGGATSSRRTQFPYQSSGTLTYDSGNYEPTLDRALELVGHAGLRAEQQRRRDAGEHEAPRRRPVHLRRDVRPGPQPGAGRAQLRGRRLGGGHRARAADRGGPGGERHDAPRPGPRDVLVADRGREVRREPRRSSRCSTPTRPPAPQGMDTYGSRSLPVGGVAVAMAADEVVDQGQAPRRPPARMRRGGPRAGRRRAAACGARRRSR